MPDVAVHIVQRGHDRRDCFLHDTDYLVYLSNLRDLAPASACALHAYCLMTNHVHLLVTPASPQSCAALMRNLGQRYVQYFNRRYERRGTLWEGRFRSCLVDSAMYAIACHRYIERNPVRAGMVSAALDYRWSSYGGNAGHAANRILSPHSEYLALGGDDASRHAAYRSVVAADDDPAFLEEIRDATNGGFALLGQALNAKLPAELQRRLVRRSPGRPVKPPRHTDRLSAELELELGLRPRI